VSYICTHNVSFYLLQFPGQCYPFSFQSLGIPSIIGKVVLSQEDENIQENEAEQSTKMFWKMLDVPGDSCKSGVVNRG